MSTKTILDVSRYQGMIDWDAVVKIGLVDGVMLKTVSTNRSLSSRPGLCIQLQGDDQQGREQCRRQCHHDRRCHRMSLCKMDKSLKELHRKLEEEQKLREMPGLVAEIEDALCEQDMASQERMATIEDSLCELDAAVNK